MPCSHVTFKDENGKPVHAIVKYARRPKPKCTGCGQRNATRECDWKMGEGKTCDAPLCTGCTREPAPDKDLCPEHYKQWIAMVAERATKRVLEKRMGEEHGQG